MGWMIAVLYNGVTKSVSWQTLNPEGTCLIQGLVNNKLKKSPVQKCQSSKEREQSLNDQEDEYTFESDLLLEKRENIMKCLGIFSRI